MNRIFAAALAVLAFAAAPAMAATLTTNGSNQLTGITGLTVGSSTYNVEFVDGTCAAVFGGCDSLSDFTFQNQPDAHTAGDALLAAIVGSSFDTAPGTTFGCIGGASCFMLIPYGFDGLQVGSADAQGVFNGAASNSNATHFGVPPSTDLGTNNTLVWARFTAAAGAVPEPSSWAMMLLGFLGIGLAVRRRMTGRFVRA
jgi:hypothetical protein